MQKKRKKKKERKSPSNDSNEHRTDSWVGVWFLGFEPWHIFRGHTQGEGGGTIYGEDCTNQLTWIKSMNQIKYIREKERKRERVIFFFLWSFLKFFYLSIGTNQPQLVSTRDLTIPLIQVLLLCLDMRESVLTDKLDCIVELSDRQEDIDLFLSIGLHGKYSSCSWGLALCTLRESSESFRDSEILPILSLLCLLRPKNSSFSLRYSLVKKELMVPKQLGLCSWWEIEDEEFAIDGSK